MHILFLAQIIPYPPDAGPKVKTWHVLRYLKSRGHQVTFLAFVRPEEEEYLPVMRKLCHAVHTVPIKRSRIADIGYMVRSFITGRPFLIERDDLSGMRQLVKKILTQETVDVIHADQLTMVQFALGQVGNPKVIFDAHNAVWTIVDRMLQNASWFLKPILSIETQRVKRYESQLLNKVDWVLTVTEEDKKAFIELVDGENPTHTAPISVVPIAVDTQQLRPVTRSPNSNAIFTLGTLHYPPNADGIRWFLNQVFPLIRLEVPNATLTIVGKNPPSDFLEQASLNPDVIRVTGYVNELYPYLEKSAITVVPVRAGGGMRVRILEAFAFGMPVVTTTVGLEGIRAESGQDVLIGDTPTEFANQVVQLLTDEKEQLKLAFKGRQMVENRYDWQVVLTEMDTVYETLVG